MEQFHDWKAAHTYAVERARAYGMDMAIRKVKIDLYKRGKFAVSIASRNDSDYALAEIVRPGDPL